MCVSPTHTCLFIGMLMPAMRAMVFDSPSPLALLVARVFADNVDHAPAAHDLAVLADPLDRRTYFHFMASGQNLAPVRCANRVQLAALRAGKSILISPPIRCGRSRAGSPS